MSLSFLSPLYPVARITISDLTGRASPSINKPSLQKLTLCDFFKMMLPSSTFP